MKTLMSLIKYMTNMTTLPTSNFIRPQENSLQQSLKTTYPWLTSFVLAKQGDLIELRGRKPCHACHQPVSFNIMVPLVGTVNISQQIQSYLAKNPDLMP